MKGQLNMYQCDNCSGEIVTRDADDGVTPFMIRCRATEGCPGWMQSFMYRVPEGAPEPTHEWYIVSTAEFDKASEGMQQHYMQGGLELRRIAK